MGDKIGKFLRSSYGLFLVVVAYTIMLIAMRNAWGHHPWAIGDWLISYQGGFVRRGFLGEVLYRVALVSHIDPAYLAAGLQILALWTYIGMAYHSLWKQPDWRPYLLLLVSPYIFLFQIYDRAGGFRKEILYFAVLALLVWTALYRPQSIQRWTTWVLLLYPLFVLSHEMLALFIPFLLIPYFWHHPNARPPKVFILLMAQERFTAVGRDFPRRSHCCSISL